MRATLLATILTAALLAVATLPAWAHPWICVETDETGTICVIVDP